MRNKSYKTASSAKNNIKNVEIKLNKITWKCIELKRAKSRLSAKQRSHKTIPNKQRAQQSHNEVSSSKLSSEENLIVNTSISETGADGTTK